jgi:hypothetical protein
MSEILSSLMIEVLGAAIVAVLAASLICQRLYSRVQRLMGRDARVHVVLFPSSEDHAAGAAWMDSIGRRGFRLTDNPSEADSVILWSPRDAAAQALAIYREQLKAGAVLQIYAPVQLPCRPGDAMLANSVARLELDLQGVLSLAARGS